MEQGGLGPGVNSGGGIWVLERCGEGEREREGSGRWRGRWSGMDPVVFCGRDCDFGR